MAFEASARATMASVFGPSICSATRPPVDGNAPRRRDTGSARVPAPHRHRPEALGQTLVIFALIATMLFGTVGLAVDSGLSYLASASAERAAAAGATAGVVYMPSAFATTATTIAKSVASQNGFTDLDTTGGPPKKKEPERQFLYKIYHCAVHRFLDCELFVRYKAGIHR